MLEDIKKSFQARISLYIYIYIYIYIFLIVINNYYFYKDLTNKILILFVPKKKKKNFKYNIIFLKKNICMTYLFLSSSNYFKRMYCYHNKLFYER